MKKIFLSLVIIMFVLAGFFFAVRRVWKAPGARLMSYGKARGLTSQELSVLRQQPGAGALPGNFAPSDPDGLPSNAKNNLNTVNQVQKINTLNRKQNK